MSTIDIDKESLFLSDDKVFYTIEGEGEYLSRGELVLNLAMILVEMSAIDWG
jgi:hypothetical protein